MFSKNVDLFWSSLPFHIKRSIQTFYESSIIYVGIELWLRLLTVENNVPSFFKTIHCLTSWHLIVNDTTNINNYWGVGDFDL